MGIDENLGAWALDALDADEADLLDDLVAAGGDPALSAEARVLQDVVARMGELQAISPPAELRSSVLDGARATGRAVDAATPLTVYTNAVARLEAELRALGEDAAAGPVAAYGWSVHGLVAHLVEVERYFTEIVGIAEPTELSARASVPTDHLTLGGDPVGDAPALAPFEALVDEWAATTGRAIDYLHTLDPGTLESEISFHGLPMRRSTLLVVRGFELWTHADDVRVAAGARVADPPAAELHTMADRAVRGLPGLLLLDGVVMEDTWAHIVLTGPGGGTWDLDLDLDGGSPDASPTEPTVTLIADIADWCRMAARRLRVDELDVEVEGDAGLGRQLMQAAAAVAL